MQTGDVDTRESTSQKDLSKTWDVGLWGSSHVLGSRKTGMDQIKVDWQCFVFDPVYEAVAIG